MRRLGVGIILAIMFLTSAAFGQTGRKENVKALVQKEIHQAIGLNKAKEEDSGGGLVLLKLIIIASAGIGSFGYVYWRRKKSVTDFNTKLAANKIELIKKEKLVYRMDPRLRIIRNKLLETVQPAALKYETVKENAKRLNISQEEILLAARLNLYKNNCAKNKVGGYVA